MKSTGTAYLLWLLCFVGICGVHRMYAGRVVSGLLWLITLGFFGVGTLIDLFLIPGMIDYANLKFAAYAGVPVGNKNANANTNVVHVHLTGTGAVPSPQTNPANP